MWRVRIDSRRAATFALAGAFVVFVVWRAASYPPDVRLFTIAACAAWAIAMAWAVDQWRTPDQWHHVVVLATATLFWWAGEHIAIRLGRYDYTIFPLTLPGGGARIPSDMTTRVLRWLRFDMTECAFQRGLDVPFAVVAAEAAVVFGLVRMSVARFERKGLAAWAAAALAGLLMVNLTTTLDPVVSNSVWCGRTAAMVSRQGLGFSLWTWYTEEWSPGYFFGVPLVNYTAWFFACAAFTCVERFDELAAKYDRSRVRFSLLYIPGLLLAMFVVLIPAQLAGRWVLITLPRRLFGDSFQYLEAWQFAAVGALLVAAGTVAYLGRAGHPRHMKWIFVAPMLFVFTYCLVLALGSAYFGGPNWTLLAIWIVNFALGVIASRRLWLALVRRDHGAAPPRNATSPAAV